MKRNAIPILVILMSVFWLYKGIFAYGVWYAGGPGGGFMAALSSILAILFSIVMIVKPDAAAKPVARTTFIPLAMVGAALTLSMVVGLLPALAAMMFVWIWKLERYPPARALFITACPMAVVYGIFRLWLQVPFPTGMFGI